MEVRIYSFKDIENELRNYCGYFGGNDKCINKYISDKFDYLHKEEFEIRPKCSTKNLHNSFNPIKCSYCNYIFPKGDIVEMFRLVKASIEENAFYAIRVDESFMGQGCCYQ